MTPSDDSIPASARSVTAPAGARSVLFVRPRDGRWIGGVCAAIADRFGWNRTLVRAATVILTLFTAVPVFVYLAFWIAVPAER